MNWSPEVATAVATVVIAGFTFILALGGAIQAWLTRKAINLSRDEFTATHRPRIVVRGVEMHFGDDGKIDGVAFRYINAGETPATVVEIGAEVPIAGQLPSGMKFTKHKISGVTLVSGEGREFVVPAPDLHTARAIAQTRAPSPTDQTSILVGYVIYEDPGGRRRKMGFYRISRVSGFSWATDKDSEYEYSD